MKAIRVTVSLAAFLREFALKPQGEFTIEIPEGSTVKDLIHYLKIPEEKVKVVMINGKGIDFSIDDGDRIALFPPEIAFNNYVALGFRKDSGRFQQ